MSLPALLFLSPLDRYDIFADIRYYLRKTTEEAGRLREDWRMQEDGRMQAYERCESMQSMQKYRVIGVLLMGIVLFAGCGATATDRVPDPKEWQLVWADEFDGEGIDPAKWSYVIGAGGYGNNELQYYSDREKNVRIESSRAQGSSRALARSRLKARALSSPRSRARARGWLVLEAWDDGLLGSSYTSAKVTTQGKASWRYGRFDVRARLPEGQGLWPAVWMMPNDSRRYGPWPAGGEIDIMELLGHEPKQVHGTLHYGEPHTDTGATYRLRRGKFSGGFHQFTLEWEPGVFRWYVDGELYQTQTEWFSAYEGRKFGAGAPFDREFYLQLNVAVGGDWPGDPDGTTAFPQAMQVDYVRVYQRPGGWAVGRQYQ